VLALARARTVLLDFVPHPSFCQAAENGEGVAKDPNKEPFIALLVPNFDRTLGEASAKQLFDALENGSECSIVRGVSVYLRFVFATVCLVRVRSRPRTVMPLGLIGQPASSALSGLSDHLPPIPNLHLFHRTSQLSSDRETTPASTL